MDTISGALPIPAQEVTSSLACPRPRKASLSPTLPRARRRLWCFPLHPVGPCGLGPTLPL